jgi:quercetin dioxygenase-like cupin family protein
MALLAQAREVAAQPAGSPVKVDTKGLVAKIKFEVPVAGFLTDLNGKYKLRVTELTLAPGGYVGEHNHVGPGIRQVTSGYMTYVLPDKTVVY